MANNDRTGEAAVAALTLGQSLSMIAGEPLVSDGGDVLQVTTAEQRRQVAAVWRERLRGLTRRDPSDAALFAALFVTNAAQRDPGSMHFLTARDVLGRLDDDNDDAAADKLARALANAARDLAERVDAHGALDQLAEALKHDDGDQADAADAWAMEAATAWDEALADLLDGLGKRGKSYAAAVRERTRLRADELADALQKMSLPVEAPEAPSGLLWGEWLDFDEVFDDVGHLCPALVRLADALWSDVVRPSLHALPMAIHAVEVLGSDDDDDADLFVKLPKALAPLSWAMGGAGNVLEIDGELYAAEPTAPRVCVVPRSWDLLPSAATKGPASQRVLPLQIPGDDPLPLAIVSQSRATLSPQAGKAALVLLATARGVDTTVRAELGDLARLIYPDTRIRKTHLTSLARGLHELEGLYAVNPDDWTKVRCFDLRVPIDPRRPRKDQAVEWRMGGLFMSAVRREWLLREPDAVDSLRGHFVINLSGAMRLPMLRDSLLRHYVRAAAVWNDAHSRAAAGGFNPDQMPWYPMGQWLGLVNSLSTRAADYMAGKGRGGRARVSKAEDQKRGASDLAELHDRGLLVLEKKGRSWDIRPMPPEDLLEAWEGFRKARGRRRPL